MNKRTANKLLKQGYSNEYLEKCLEIKNKRKGRYLIIVTGDRCDYDDLSELMNYPERGEFLDKIAFDTPDELEPIVSTYEGMFYQLFDREKSITEKIGGGVVDDSIWEDWWNEECQIVCKFCFLRLKNDTENYGCRKEL